MTRRKKWIKRLKFSSLYREYRYIEDRYIGVLSHTFYCNFCRDIEYSSLYREYRYVEDRYIGVPLYFGFGFTTVNLKLLYFKYWIAARAVALRALAIKLARPFGHPGKVWTQFNLYLLTCTCVPFRQDLKELHHRSWKFSKIVISNPFQSSPSSAILVPFCCRINPLVFFFLRKLLFLGFPLL